MIGLQQSSPDRQISAPSCAPALATVAGGACLTRFPLLRFRQVRAINCGGSL